MMETEGWGKDVDGGYWMGEREGGDADERGCQ